MTEPNTKRAIEILEKRVERLSFRLEFGGDALNRIDAEIESYKACDDFGKFAASDRLTLLQFTKTKKSVATAMQKDRNELQELTGVLNELKGSP